MADESESPRFLRKEQRLERHKERLGMATPKCVVPGCDVGDPRCLELHHIAGRHFGDELVVLCRNHHRILSDDQKDHPKRSTPEPSSEERISHFLLGLADLLALLVDYCRDFARAMVDTAGVERSKRGRP